MSEGIVTLNYVRCAPALICCAVILCSARVLAGQPSTPVTAVVLPDGRYSKVAIHEMGREAAHILKTSGVSLHWRIGETAQSVDGLLVVVKLVGRCDMDGPSVFLMPGPLGWSHQVNGVVLPFSNLACDNIRGVVQSTATVGSQFRGNFLLGRAMGRVLAHELYHIVADTSQHGENGVAQSALSARELTSGQLELRPADVEAIQSGLRQGR
jgi:hypothetical protein